MHFSFLLKFEYNFLYANSRDPDQTPRSAVSDLGLHCFSMYHKKDTRLKWVYVFQQTSCLVVNQVTVGNFAFLSNCTPAGQALDSTTVLT